MSLLLHKPSECSDQGISCTCLRELCEKRVQMTLCAGLKKQSQYKDNNEHPFCIRVLALILAACLTELLQRKAEHLAILFHIL